MQPLKLIALDEEDLAIVSAHVQDAIARVGDIDWRPAENVLTLVVARFVWEGVGDRTRTYERRHAGLAFRRVRAVRSQNIRRDRPDGILDLLAVTFEPTDAPAGVIRLVFAGGGELRLDVECIEAQLGDLGSAWATGALPRHDAAPEA